jgi:hypothetical protein
MLPDDLAQELREKLLLLLAEYLPEDTAVGRLYRKRNKPFKKFYWFDARKLRLWRYE